MPDIRALIVKKQHRGKGFGGTLLEECLKRARKFAQRYNSPVLVLLHSVQDQEKFYREHGFGRTPDDPPKKGKDADIPMQLRVSPLSIVETTHQHLSKLAAFRENYREPSFSDHNLLEERLSAYVDPAKRKKEFTVSVGGQRATGDIKCFTALDGNRVVAFLYAERMVVGADHGSDLQRTLEHRRELTGRGHRYWCKSSSQAAGTTTNECNWQTYTRSA